MATGDFICEICNQYQCVCGIVLKNLLKDKEINFSINLKNILSCNDKKTIIKLMKDMDIKHD